MSTTDHARAQGISSAAEGGAPEPAPAVAHGASRIGIVTDDDALDAGRWWAQHAQAGWPGAAAPALVLHTIEDVLMRADVPAQLAGLDAVCVVAGASAPASAIKRCCASLVEHSGAVVCVLAPELAHAGVALAACGALVHEHGRAPGALGGLLAGLASRQHMVREREVELRARAAMNRHVGSELSKVDSELLLAAKLQREIMRSDSVTLPGLDWAALYRPAWYVSGDVYRLVRTGEHTSGLVLADAMGHGVSAAMYSMLIANAANMKEALAAGACATEAHRALEKLNGVLHQPDSESTRFASAVCAQIDAATGEVRFASAGHPDGLVLSSDGRVRASLGSTGPLLGVMEQAEFECAQALLEPGDVLALYTDGLEEMLGAHAVVPTLARVVGECAGNVQAAIAQLHTLLDACPGSLAPKDDVTVLLLARL